MILKVLDRLSSGELRTEFSKISSQDVLIYSESLAIVRLTMHLIRNGQDPFHFQFECDGQNIDEYVNEYVDERVKIYADESVNKFVDESVNIVDVHEGFKGDVDTSVNSNISNTVNEDLAMDRDDNAGGFETVAVVAVIISEFSRGTVVTDSPSVSTLIPPRPTTFSAVECDSILLNLIGFSMCGASGWNYISKEPKPELWPPDNLSSHCTIRDDIL